MQLIEDFSVSLKLGLCIQPNELTLTTLLYSVFLTMCLQHSISGNLPELTINFSLDTYHFIMQLLSIFAPKQGEAPAQPQVQTYVVVFCGCYSKYFNKGLGINFSTRHRSLKRSGAATYQKENCCCFLRTWNLDCERFRCRTQGRSANCFRTQTFFLSCKCVSCTLKD